MLFNLTPHPMRFFAEHTPDRVAAEDARAPWTLPLERIRFGAHDGQPATTLPNLVAGVLVNGATIRDLDGNTLGARSLARPWRP